MSLVILQILTTQIGDWTISVHPRHGSKDHDKKHVHVKKRGMKGEYSWNEDGTRHDKHRFPGAEQCFNRARDLAASALNVPANTLQLITGFEGGVFVSVQDNWYAPHINKEFNSYVHKGKFVTILGGSSGLVIVIDNA